MRAGGKQWRKTFKLWNGRRIGHKEVNNDKLGAGYEVIHLLSLMIQNECLAYKQTQCWALNSDHWCSHSNLLPIRAIIRHGLQTSSKNCRQYQSQLEKSAMTLWLSGDLWEV